MKVLRLPLLVKVLVMKILITGATGFIGQNLVKKLTKEGHTCRCLVRKTSNIDSLNGEGAVEFIYGDISQKNSLTNVCEGIDIVVNSAGMLGKWDSSVEDLKPVNTDGILNLSNELIKHKVQYVIHLSAGGVTGPVKGPPADEGYECCPITPYEKTKLEGENNALSLYKHFDIPLVIVRPTFTYGPGDPHKLPLFRAVKKRKFVFIGTGESTNHPVYIDDLLKGISILMDKRPVGEIFILGGKVPVAKRDLIETIAHELGVESNFFHVPRPLATIAAHCLVSAARIMNFEPILTPSRVNMMADNWGYSIVKAREFLGYEPEIDLKTGIHRTALSYKDLGWI